MIELLPPNTAPHPGVCLTCGSSGKDLILFDVTQPWNGALLLCVECFKGVAIMFQDRLGIVDVKHLEILQVERDLLSGRLDNFGAAVFQLKGDLSDALDGFYRYLDSESGGSDSTASGFAALLSDTDSTTTNRKQPEVNE